MKRGLSVLALDLSGPGGGAALLTPEGISTKTLAAEVRRGRDLVPGIRDLLEEASRRVEELDLVACGVGPGSFTGIRIAVSTAAALAYAAGRPVLAVDSLRGLVSNAPAEAQWALPVLDARRARVFCALYRRSEESEAWREVRAPATTDPAALRRDLPAETWVLGDGVSRYPEAFEGFPSRAEAPPRPDTIARVAAARFTAGERLDPTELRPLYLRASDPEIRKRERDAADDEARPR